MNIKRLAWPLFAPLLLAAFPGMVAAQDGDSDGMPASWEAAHHMNDDNDGDAAVDFDRDGLDSLQEYTLQLRGKGSGPSGRWTAALVTLSPVDQPGMPMIKTIVAMNDHDDVLVNVRNLAGTVREAWVRKAADGSWRKLSTVQGTQANYVYGYDLNNKGQVVGIARATGVNGGMPFGFLKDAWAGEVNTDVEPWHVAAAPFTPVKALTGINNWGDVIGTGADGSSIFESELLGSVSCPMSWNNPVFTDINDWGEVVGVENSDPVYNLGIGSHFLMTPDWTWHMVFPGWLGDYYGRYMGDIWEEEGAGGEDFGGGAFFRPSLMNDWGEFAGNFAFNYDYEPVADGSWYYDGRTYYDGIYHQHLPFNYKQQRIHGMNNWPQVLLSGKRSDEGEDPETVDQRAAVCFVHVAGINIPLSSLAPNSAVVEAPSFEPICINNRSTILGFTGASGNSLYFLRLDQDRDGDGMPDDWEEYHDLDPDDASDATGDSDADGYANVVEWRLGGDPTDPSSGSRTGDAEERAAIDADGDGLPDAWERKHLGSLEGGPDEDADDDGLSNFEEWVLGTDPGNWDTDGDWFGDGEETFDHGTDALKADTDGDGIPDLAENLGGSDPKDPDDRPRFPPYLRIEVKTVTNSELIPDEFVTPGDDYWAVHYPLHPDYNQGFSSALATLSEADKDHLPEGDQNPHKRTRLVCDNPGTEDYRLPVLRITEIYGDGEGNPQVTVETKEFIVPAGQKVSNEIDTVAQQVGRVYLLPVEVAPDKLASNGDFNEGDTGATSAQTTGAKADNRNQTLIAARDSTDGSISAGDIVTEDLHEGWFGLLPDAMPDEFFDGATITITNLAKTDPATGEREEGTVRFFATWGENEEVVIDHSREPCATWS